uniref:Uncharacterized protein n=1 Tax=Noccaea caerulescens TaxID=107243 RepID=A0A1J3DAR0_NOCCA
MGFHAMVGLDFPCEVQDDVSHEVKVQQVLAILTEAIGMKVSCDLTETPKGATSRDFPLVSPSAKSEGPLASAPGTENTFSLGTPNNVGGLKMR